MAASNVLNGLRRKAHYVVGDVMRNHSSRGRTDLLIGAFNLLAALTPESAARAWRPPLL
jgi:hypothetical protein